MGMDFRASGVWHSDCKGEQFIPKPTKSMNTNNDHCISVCNELLRGELSAVETYDQAIEKYADLPAAEELQRIREEHSRAASMLAENVRNMGGEPEMGSGAWGVFATAVQGTANLFGANSALESLQKGEEAGRNDYQEALTDDEVMPECKEMIREELLPSVIEHIACLEKLEHAA
jgi:uncharacterized protein (TIGR02284 family)